MRTGETAPSKFFHRQLDITDFSEMKTGQKAPADIVSQFREAGFEVARLGTNPDSIEVKKNGCVQRLARDSAGSWAPSGPPSFIVRGLRCKLEDRGYQKFWYADGKRFPIRKTDLETHHRFSEEIKSILGLGSLYHESLGSTCARTVYDRLIGRPEK